VRHEKIKNELAIHGSMGNPVTFGSEVQLMHVESKSFLCGSNICSQNTKIGYQCTLSQWFSKRMIFKIIPKLKSRNEGEYIQYRDMIIFENIENTSYLSFSYDQEVNIFQTGHQVSGNPFRPILAAGSLDYKTLECFMSLLPQTAFCCIFHSPSRRDERKVYGQQIVRIIHTETDGRLAADISYKDKQPEVHLRVNEGEFPLEANAGNTVWEIENVKIIDNGKPLKIEPYDEEEESKYTLFPIVLKHLVSNLRLESKSKGRDSVTNIEVDKELPVLEKIKEISKPQHEITESQKLLFYPLVKNHDYVEFDSSYFIASSTKHFLKCEYNSFYSRDKKKRIFMDLNDKERDHFEPIVESMMGLKKYRASFTRGINTKDTFLIKRVPQAEVQNIQFIKSVVHMLGWMCEFFKQPHGPGKVPRKYPTNAQYLKLVKVLNKLMFFVTDLEPLSADIQDAVEAVPNPEKQQLIKDFGVIDLIMEIIYYPLKNEFYNLIELKDNCEFTPVIRACYVGLRKGIEEYRPNELHASQWLRVIIDHSLSTSSENDIQADRTMRELIDNNRVILETRITKDTVRMYIQSLKSSVQRDNKYIVILRALCNCNGVPIVHNQKMLTELILLDDDTRQSLLVPLRMEDFRVEIYLFDQHAWEDFEVFVADKVASRAKYYSYLLSMINLLGDMSYGRNYMAIEVVQKLYQINICLLILMNENIPFEVREAFGKLITHCWINVTPFYKIVLPDPIKTFEGLSNQLTFSYFHGQKIIYDKVKAYIPRFVEAFASKPTYSDIQEISLLNTLLEIML
jgi:hypothetical protein